MTAEQRPRIAIDGIRDELARRARKRGLHPVDLELATEGLVKHAHIAAWFAGRCSMPSPKVSALAVILGLRFTDDTWEKPK